MQRGIDPAAVVAVAVAAADRRFDSKSVFAAVAGAAACIAGAEVFVVVVAVEVLCLSGLIEASCISSEGIGSGYYLYSKNNSEFEDSAGSNLCYHNINCY